MQQRFHINDTLYVRPQDLASVHDFIIFWEDSWSKSLVYYHPEFLYHHFCLDNEKSHEFDDIWLNKEDYENLYATSTAFLNPLGNIPANAFDPYFSSNTSINPVFDAVEYTTVKNKLNNYISNNGTTYNIWQMAWATVHCPSYNNDPALGSCQTPPDCFATFTPQNFHNDKDVMKVFKSYYLSLKQQYQEQKATRYAINSTCYNGCFGDSSFTYSKDNFIYYSTRRTSWPFGWGWWGWRSQAWNGEQPCSVYSSQYYRGKRARYPRLYNLMGNPSYRAEVCYDEVSQGQYQEVNCAAQNDLIRKELENEADFAYVENCGECPVTKDIQTLLDAVAKKEKLKAVNEQLSCYPASQYPEFVPDLEKAMNLTGKGEVIWKTRSSNSTTLLVDMIRMPDLDTCTLELGMQASYQLPSFFTGAMRSYSFSWDDIKSICCIETSGPFTLLPADPFHNFTVNASVFIQSPTESEAREVKIKLEGRTCINLKECPTPVLCNENHLSGEVVSLLNTLTLNLPSYTSEDDVPVSYPAITPQLISSALAIDTAVAPWRGIIGGEFKKTYPTSKSFVWNSTIDQDILKATLTGKTNAGTDAALHSLNLWTADGSLMNTKWTKIVSFNTLRIDRDEYETMYENGVLVNASYFTIYAKVEIGPNQYTFVKLKGSTTLPIGTCRQPSVQNSNN